MSVFLAFLPFGSGNLLPVLSGIIALGVVVLLHEIGHFIVAKLSGIRVEAFSIGFPPKMFGFKIGETEYRLSWILFGGYVKLAGMDFEDGVDPRSVKGGYFASPLRTRVAVCLCGPLMNFASAFLIYCGLYAAGYPVPANMESTVVGTVVSGSPADRAGVLPGDRITGVNGKTVRRWEDVSKSIWYSTGETVEVAFEREKKLDVKKIVPEKDEKLKLRRIGIYPADLISVDVLKASVAEAAGLKSGDFIMTVDGRALYSWEQLTEIIKSREGKEVALGLLRGGLHRTVKVVPRYNQELGYPAIGIGIRAVVPMEELEENGLVIYTRRNPFSWIGQNVAEMYLTIKGLILRTLSPRGLAGPIRMVQIMSYSARAGLRQFLFIIAFISVNLAVINLLPIPVLDGGHILFTVIEGLAKRPLSVRTMALVQNAFMAILIALMAMVFANDIISSWGDTIARFINRK